MNTHLLTKLYRLFLRLLPRSFQEEFAEEMEWVFSQTISDAAAEGGFSLLHTGLRELSSIPVEAVRWRIAPRRVDGMLAGQLAAWEGPPVRKEAFITLAVFLLPAAGLLSNGSGFTVDGAIQVIFGCILLGALIYGAARGFPRWSLPYLGLALSTISFLLLFEWQADLLSPYALAKIGIVPQDESTLLVFQSLWAGMMWLSLFAVTALVLGLLSLLQRFRPFIRRICKDWTLASYILYSGALALLTLSFAQHNSLKPYAAGSILCLATGAWLYLYSPRPWQRFLALLSGLSLAVAAAVIGQWPVVPLELSPNWQNWPGSNQNAWLETRLVFLEWILMAIVILAPSLLRFLYRPAKTCPASL